MGNSYGLPRDVCLDDFLNDLHALYPGIEEQIEDAYLACTMSSEGETEGLTYNEVEPLMRHFIYQVGLGELLPRVCDESGALRISEITPLLHAASVHLDMRRKLNCDDWKILVVAWVRRLQEEQQADLERWHSHLNKMQYQQEQQFDAALKAFQTTYIGQIESYHREVEADHLREEELRRQWEENQEIQEAFYESQQEYLKHMNKTAEQNYCGRQLFQQQEFVNQVKAEAQKINRVPFEGANKCYSYVYPTDTTAVGAPISGGFPTPIRKAPRKTPVE